MGIEPRFTQRAASGHIPQHMMMVAAESLVLDGQIAL